MEQVACRRPSLTGLLINSAISCKVVIATRGVTACLFSHISAIRWVDHNPWRQRGTRSTTAISRMKLDQRFGRPGATPVPRIYQVLFDLQAIKPLLRRFAFVANYGANHVRDRGFLA